MPPKKNKPPTPESDIGVGMEKAQKQVYIPKNDDFAVEEDLAAMKEHFKEEVGEEQRAIIKNVFNLFDVQHDGAISTKELGQCLAALGVKNLSRDYLRGLMKKYDEDESGELDFEEFITLMKEAFRDELTQIELLFKPNEAITN